MPKTNSVNEYQTFSDLAHAVVSDCFKTGQPVPYAAVPYIKALEQIHSADPGATIPGFPLEDARFITMYLLGNLRTYKGEGARANKTALKKMAGIK